MVKNLLLCFFSLCLCLLAIEGIYRYQWSKQDWVDLNTQFDSELGWTNIPNSERSNAWGKMTHNELGFRSEPFDPSKEQIVLLGDSVAWGYGVDDGQTIAAYLQQKVETLGYQVSNLGVSGYGLDQTYLHFKKHLDKFENLSFVILILNAENDLIDVGSNARYAKSKPYFSFQNNQLQLKGQPVKRYSLRNVFSESILVRRLSLLHPRIQNFFSNLAGDYEMDEGGAKSIAETLILEMRELARDRGASFLVLNSPSLLDFTEGPIDFLWASGYIKKKGIFSIEVESSLKEHFPSIQGAYYDQEHYSDQGSALIANEIFKHLKR